MTMEQDNLIRARFIEVMQESKTNGVMFGVRKINASDNNTYARLAHDPVHGNANAAVYDLEANLRVLRLLDQYGGIWGAGLYEHISAGRLYLLFRTFDYSHVFDQGFSLGNDRGLQLVVRRAGHRTARQDISTGIDEVWDTQKAEDFMRDSLGTEGENILAFGFQDPNPNISQENTTYYGPKPMDIIRMVYEATVKKGLIPKASHTFYLGRSMMEEARNRGLDPKWFTTSDGRTLRIFGNETLLGISLMKPHSRQAETFHVILAKDDENGEQSFEIPGESLDYRMSQLIFAACEQLLGVDFSPQEEIQQNR